jgi:hypothetical protein
MQYLTGAPFLLFSHPFFPVSSYSSHVAGISILQQHIEFHLLSLSLRTMLATTESIGWEGNILQSPSPRDILTQTW